MTFIATNSSYPATAFATNWNTQKPVESVAFNDIYIDAGGNLVTVGSVDDVQQSVVQSLWMWRGEYNFDVFLGVPYNLILGNPDITESLIRYYLTNSILLINDFLNKTQLAEYGIKEISSMTFNFNGTTRTEQTTITITLNNGQSINLSA